MNIELIVILNLIIEIYKNSKYLLLTTRQSISGNGKREAVPRLSLVLTRLRESDSLFLFHPAPLPFFTRFVFLRAPSTIEHYSLSSIQYSDCVDIIHIFKLPEII